MEMKNLNAVTNPICEIAQILLKSEREPTMQVYLQQLGDSKSADDQISILKKIFTSVNIDGDVRNRTSVVHLLSVLYIATPPKNPIKKMIARFLLTLDAISEMVVDALSKALEHYIILLPESTPVFIAQALNGCFENFQPGILAVEHRQKLLFPIFMDALGDHIQKLRTVESARSKTSLCADLHIISRALVSIMTQCRVSAKNDIESFMYLSNFIIQHPDVPMDTKGNFGIILVCTAKTLKGKPGLLQIVHLVLGCYTKADNFWPILRFKTVVQKICLCVGIFNSLTEAELCDDFGRKNKPPVIMEFGKMMVDIAETSSTSLNTEALLVVMRNLLIASKSVTQISEKDKKVFIDFCLFFTWTHLDHYVDSIRHISKNIMVNIVKIAVNLSTDATLVKVIEDVLKIDNDRVALYIGLAIIGAEAGCEKIFVYEPDLVPKLLGGVVDKTISTYACSTYLSLMKGNLASVATPKWIETWIAPLLLELAKATAESYSILLSLLVDAISIQPIVAKYIYKQYAVTKINDPSVLLACVLVVRKSGSMKDIAVPSETKWRGVLDINFMENAMFHYKDEVRLAALSVISQSHKSTEMFSMLDFKLILKFLTYNFNLQEASSRQQVLAQIKKIIVRVKETYCVIKKQVKNCELRLQQPFCANLEPRELDKLVAGSKDWSELLAHYVQFICDIRALAFKHLFPGANFNRRVFSLEVLVLMKFILDGTFSDSVLWTKKEAEVLILCLDDSYERNKKLALKLLANCPPEYLSYNDPITVNQTITYAISLASSNRPTDTITGAYLLQAVLYYPVAITVLQQSTGMEYKCKFFLVITLLLNKLREQLEGAKESLLIAAGNAPMYGILFCIRHFFEFYCMGKIVTDAPWTPLIKSLIEICFELKTIVAPIVNNSSPEGHLPSDHETVSKILTPNFTNKTVTAQMVLLCAWRTVKEVSLLLGDISENAIIISNDNVINEPRLGAVTEKQIISIGEHFTNLLAETKHRGAFEQAHIGFMSLCGRLWKMPVGRLAKLPRLWLSEIIQSITAPDEEKNAKLCATRRSAGLPFMVQALVATELQVGGRPTCFHECMVSLLEVGRLRQVIRGEPCTHAMNILRALYRHNLLGEHCGPYIADGVMIAIQGFSSEIWGVRNAATLLFSALMTRIFGVPRNKDSDDINIRNKMTVRVFFIRYPSLYEFLLKETERCSSTSSEQHSLYPILLLLARLYPSLFEGFESQAQITAFIPVLHTCVKNSVQKTRELAAKAIVPFINNADIPQRLARLYHEIKEPNIPTNHCHGILLEILYLLRSLKDNSMDTKTYLEDIRNTKSVLLSECYILKTTYCHILSAFIEKCKITPQFIHVLQNARDTLKETNTDAQLGTRAFELAFLQLKFHIYYMEYIFNRSLGILKEFQELLAEKLHSSDDKIIVYLLNFFICLFETKTHLFDELDIPDYEKKFVNRFDDSFKESFISQIKHSRNILGELHYQFTHNTSFDCKAKLYLVASYFSDNIKLILEPSITDERILKNLINLCREGHDSVCSSVLQCIDTILWNIKADTSAVANETLSALYSLMMELASPEVPYSCRRTVAEILKDNPEILTGKWGYTRCADLCVNWMTVLNLTEDVDRDIRETVSYILNRDVLPFSERAREELFEMAVNTIQKYSREDCTAFLLTWILRDSAENDDEDLDEARVFDKGEMNTYAEDVYMARIACTHLTKIFDYIRLNTKVSIGTYITNILTNEAVVKWFPSSTELGRAALLRRFQERKNSEDSSEVNTDFDISKSHILCYKLILLEELITYRTSDNT